MSDEEDDDLFADSDDDEVESPKKKSPAKKPAAAPAKKASKKPDKDDDDDDDLFDSDDDDDDDDDNGGKAKSSSKKPSKPKAKAPSLSKREKLEALAAKKKRNDNGGGAASSSESKKNKKKSKDSAGAAGSSKKESGYDSGDSYDSTTFQRTKDDDDFIDTTGEDADAVAELYADQHFDDERPLDEKKKKKRKISDREGGGGGGGERGEADEMNENGVPVNPIMAAVHKMKRKKREKKSLEEMEEEIKTFLGKMEMCAEEDEQAIAERRPAMSKLQFLGQVEEMLAKKDMQRNLLDFDVLSLCKRWIQPLPNGKLGNVTVRQRLLTAISHMNNGTENGIVANDLRRSELGKVVMILFKHPDETASVKRLAKQLIEQWSRPIFQKSGNMRDLEQRAGARQGTGLAAIKRRADFQQQMYDKQEMERKQVDSGKHANLQSLIATGRAGNADGVSASSNRVRVPYSKGFAYSVRPMSKTEAAGGGATESPVRGRGGGGGGGAASDNRGKLAKRMMEKGRSVNKNQRSANISVEGRATKG
ncbi:hypothetical protein ACA910_000728 [Epithemia clementina (nom. ined.)]